MTRCLATLALLAGLTSLTGCVGAPFGAAIEGTTTDVGHSSAAATDPAADVAPAGWPAPREPFDTTTITPVESTGAPAAE